jgi:hypothetical protein
VRISRLVGRHGNQVFAAVAAPSPESAEQIVARLHDQLPAPDLSARHEVTVTFWTYSRHGPQQSWRSISVPEWDEISENYTASTRAGLASIMRGFTPAHGGQLILWHGEAGFLNVVDGLIGQGLRVLVLVTTNEELKSLHPAVARPGRAAANIEFHALSRHEAND